MNEFWFGLAPSNGVRVIVTIATADSLNTKPLFFIYFFYQFMCTAHVFKYVSCIDVGFILIEMVS